LVNLLLLKLLSLFLAYIKILVCEVSFWTFIVCTYGGSYDLFILFPREITSYISNFPSSVCVDSEMHTIWCFTSLVRGYTQDWLQP
jgi:hypothetical protein